MGSQKDTLFRSSEMALTQLYISNEIGREVVSALGELGIMDFRDVSVSRLATTREIGRGSATHYEIWRHSSGIPQVDTRETGFADSVLHHSLTRRLQRSKEPILKRSAVSITLSDSSVSLNFTLLET